MKPLLVRLALGAVCIGAAGMISPADLAAQQAPAILEPPQSVTVMAGSNAVFTVSAVGLEPLSYYWRFNDTPLADGGRINGATAPNLTVTATIPADAGSYQVMVSNRLGTALSLPAQLTVISPQFSEMASLSGLWSGPLECGDFDNDGRVDLFAAGWDAGWAARTRIYRNAGGGTFLEVSGTGLPDVRDANGAVGDYDKDGNLDVLLSGQGASFVLGAFRGLGNGTFTNASPGGLGPIMAFSVNWGDVDDDGDLDVSARNYLISGSPSAFYRNDGHDTWTGLADPLPSYFLAASWCDYDQDGYGDLLASGNPGSGSVRRLFHNNRDGTFTDIGVDFAIDGSVAWGDFDNDGDPDLLISGSAGNVIYRNDGAGVFTAVTLGLPGAPAGSAIWGDFDNDGWLDVLAMGSVGGAPPVTKLFHNNGAAFFSDTGLTLPGASGPIRAADFDGDGNLDFVLSGSTTVIGQNPVLKVFRNDIITKNARPGAPGGLAAALAEHNTRVTLSWGAASDANQSGGFTYNLRLGTQPGAGDVIDPTADVSGLRRLAAPGNCGGRLDRVFTNLPPGVYYWSVQAIDHSYVGSAFAPETSFMVSRPTISDIPDQTIFPDISNAIPFQVTTVGTPVDTLTLSAVALDTNLIPTSAFAFAGSGTNRTLILTPARNQRGQTMVTVTVTDTNGATASDSFNVVVQHTFADTGTRFSATTTWGDYNNDGRLDCLVLGSPTKLFRNDGSGIFTEVTNSFPAMPSGMADWGDFNNDGWLDVAIMGWTGSERITVVYRNNGDGTFTDIGAGLPGLTGSLAWGDYDNDGDLDLLLSGTTGLNSFYLTEIYRNDHGVFIAANAGLPIAGLSKAPWGDYNRDGYLDLLLGTTVMRNNGDGTFTDIGANLEGVFGGNTSWGDYDNDGYLDVAIIGFNGLGPDARATRVYHNNHDDTFTDIGAGLVPLSNSDLAWGDFDNDGWLDLAITGTTNYMGSTWIPTLLYHNNGDGTFTDQPVELPGMGGVNWVDYDADGALDLVALNPWSVFVLYHNLTPKKNTPPAAPAGLQSLVLTNNDVRLTWSTTTDNETTNPAGLTYNLRVGTTPGGIEVMSPESDLVSGRRQVPARGNASSTNMWLLRDLPRGTYYWSVQAVDPGFAGSAFAAEALLVIANERPTISGIITQTVSHSVLSQPISFVVGDAETPAAALVVSGQSSDTNLVANEAIYLSGSGSNRVVQLRPVTNGVGTVTIRLTVADELGWTRSSRLVVNVTNLPPTVTGPTNLYVAPGVTVPLVAFQIGDAESEPDALSVAAYSSNTNLVASSNLVLSGTGPNRVLQLIPTPGVRGVSTIRIVATDSLGAAGTSQFVLRIGDFEAVASALPNVQQGAVDWGDFDNDGDLDVVICGRLAGGIAVTSVFRNNGNGTFTDIGAGLWGISSTMPTTASWGDFDGDGYLDLLLAGGGVTRVYRNLRNGAFTLIGSLPGSSAAAWVDYDNDGDLDLVLAASPATLIYRNNGDGTFSNSNIALPRSTFVAAADFDNDGDVDLTLGGSVDKQSLVTVLMRNDGRGVFTNAGISLQGVSAGSAAWSDYDQDGWLDLLLTGINGNYYFARLFWNQGAAAFSLVATNLPGMDAGTGVWGDIDGDGDADLALTGLVSGRTNGGPNARLYRNQGSDGFADTGEPLVGVYWSATAFGDYDGDGRLDLLYCGTTNGLSSGSGTFLWRNSTAAVNSPPSAPTGLAVLPGAVLSWNPGSDLQTTNAGGLTYNLRIGTTPGGTQIMSPLADPVTGWRRVARIGNAGAATRWRANLPPGTYYWSVQTIDPGFAGSPFAPENRFIVPNQPPWIRRVEPVGGGTFRVVVVAEMGLACNVWVSQDLGTWTVAGAAVETSPGRYDYVDLAAGETVRFYRVSSP